jgi:tRNA1Val (adenine37-N6)-methyltransferase
VTGATHDALFGGRVVLRQPARGEGYRTNIDALLLGAFASQGRRANVAFDLGAGAGAVGLSLLHWDAAERVVFVDVDGVASDASRTNLEANGWASRGQVVCADVRDLPEPSSAADLVVCNPPYVAPGRGRLPSRPEIARARSGDLAHFARAARRVLGRRARACFVYPSHELGALWSTLSEAGLVPKRLRAVHTDERTAARVVLIEAHPGKPGGLVISPPLFERDSKGYTREVGELLAGALSDPPRRADRARSRTPRAR